MTDSRANTPPPDSPEAAPQEAPPTQVPDRDFTDYDQDDAPRKKGSTVPLIALLVTIAVLLFGAFGYFLGAGPFFYRNILYGSGDLYALNLGPKPLWFSIDGHTPIEVKPEDARVVPLLGGTSVVSVLESPSQAPIAHYSITTDHSHAFLKLSNDGCLVAVDLDPYYGSQNPTDALVFTDKITADQHLWIPNSTNVVWPRKSFPPQLPASQGPGRWIELVACSLLEDTPDDRQFLDAYIALRLHERMARAKAQRR